MGGKRSTTCCYLLLFFMFITTSSRIRISQGADTLLQYQSLRDGQTLISANKTFVFGFFSPGSSTNRYVGIWHFKPSKTVVWVANRYTPIADKSGVLMFDSTGDLILVDGLGNSFPLDNGFGSFRGNNILVKILDSGNLILSSVNNSSMIMWQSFDYPTDTFLAGMKLGRIDKRNRFLTSWKSEVDPAPGDFSFGIDPNGTLQYFIWKERRTIYWTSGLWNGKIFSQIPELAQNYIYDFEVVSDQAEAYFSYSVKDENIISRFVMDISGQIEQLTWLDSQESWILFWSIPRTSCGVYNKCGEFGFCNNQSSACECLQGFQPASLEDWKEGRTGDGCIRKASLECDSRRNPDKYLKMPSMKIVNPYAITIIVSGAKECESACYRNCNCTAYAFSGNCSLWHGDLQNLLKIDDADDTGALYIRLAGSEFQQPPTASEFQQPPTASEFRGNKRKVQIVVSIIVSLTLLLSCSLMCFLWMRGRRHKERSLFALSNDISVKIGEGERAIDFLFFHFLDIEKATNNFSDENKLGEGGFGPVYKGQFLEGHEIAVKRLSAHSGQGLLEFRNEIILIAKLQHRNLVRLLGCCIEGGEKILVYEYMPNKSLDFFLFDTTRRALLDWTRRSLIIEGIAQGLLYLHKHSRFRIIHRDLKASNILLDADMNAKISDFGMARIVGSNETQANTNRVVGTYGYIAPEYAAQGQFSIKSDVFSFGVLLLEIISAKRNTGYHQHGNSLNLLGHAWQLWKEGRWSELKDPSLGDECAAGEVSRCIHVALMCVQENAGDRPTISDVITMLSSDNLALPDPKQPAFFRVTTITEAEQSSNLAAHCSLHEMTITTPEGR